MTAIQVLAILGYIFAYLGYFIKLSKGESPSRVITFEALTIVIVWSQLSVGWGIFLTVWSGWWFLADLVRFAKEDR